MIIPLNVRWDFFVFVKMLGIGIEEGIYIFFLFVWHDCFLNERYSERLGRSLAWISLQRLLLLRSFMQNGKRETLMKKPDMNKISINCFLTNCSDMSGIKTCTPKRARLYEERLLILDLGILLMENILLLMYRWL